MQEKWYLLKIHFEKLPNLKEVLNEIVKISNDNYLKELLCDLDELKDIYELISDSIRSWFWYYYKRWWYYQRWI